MSLAIYTLTSELHDERSVQSYTQEYLGSLRVEYEFRGSDYADFGSHQLHLIYVRTGGTEGIFKRLLPMLREKSKRPFYFLTSGRSNSLAASMEILSFLQQNGIEGEILHGSIEYVRTRIQTLLKTEEARQFLQGKRLGVIGKPSDWLISSDADYDAVRRRLGIELTDIPMQELMIAIDSCDIYTGLHTIISKYRLNGFTLRCFDLLIAMKTTGCFALARLNSEGFVAGCEGDVPAMISMMMVRALTGVSGFQANPARINPETGELLFAHPFRVGNRSRRQRFHEGRASHALQGLGRPLSTFYCRRYADGKRFRTRPVPHPATHPAFRKNTGGLLPDQPHRQPPHRSTWAHRNPAEESHRGLTNTHVHPFRKKHSADG